MISTVAVGTDGSDTAAEAVRMAVAVARAYGANLVLLSAFHESKGGPAPDAGSPELQWEFSSLARLRETLARVEDDVRREGVECHSVLDEGDPAKVLVGLADECGADLLVIGNKGMHRRMLGSVPNAVTHTAACAVLIVKTT